MGLEDVHKEDIMKITVQMYKDNIVNVLLLLLLYYLSLIAGFVPTGLGFMRRAFSQISSMKRESLRTQERD